MVAYIYICILYVVSWGINMVMSRVMRSSLLVLRFPDANPPGHPSLIRRRTRARRSFTSWSWRPQPWATNIGHKFPRDMWQWPLGIFASQDVGRKSKLLMGFPICSTFLCLVVTIVNEGSFSMVWHQCVINQAEMIPERVPADVANSLSSETCSFSPYG